jgi:hypothetical protein
MLVPFGFYDGDDNSDTNNMWSSIGPYWMGPGVAPIRVNATISGSTEFAGIQIDLSYDGENASGDRFFTDNDNVKLWIKPISMLKLTYGKMKEDDLRGKVGDFSLFAPFGYTSPWGVRNQDTIFTRFEPANGFHMALTPIEGLYVGASVDLTGAETAKDAFKTGQVGLGYAIANIGLARVQYIGTRGSPKKTFSGAEIDDWELQDPVDSGTVDADGNPIYWFMGYGLKKAVKAVDDTYTVEAAFAFTGVEGITVDFGVKIPFDVDKGEKAFEAALGAGFSSGDFGVNALVDLVAYRSDDNKATIDDVFNFYAYLQPYYNLGAFKVGGEFGFDNRVSWTDKTSTVFRYDSTANAFGFYQDTKRNAKGAMDFGAWIAKPVTGGEVQIGVMLGVPFGEDVSAGLANARFSVPISATVSF